MIAAIAAAVSAESTLRFVSGAEAFCDELALGAEASPLETLGVGASVDGCAAGALKATGCAIADGGVIMAATGSLLTGALWRPTE